MNCNCLTNSVIYKCTVSLTTTKQKIYVGFAEGKWKPQYCNSTQSFRNARHNNNTAVPSNLWKFKKKTC